MPIWRQRGLLVAGGCLLGALVAEAALRAVLPPSEKVTLLAHSRPPREIHEPPAPLQLSLRESVTEGGVLYRQTPTGPRLRPATRALIEHHRVGGSAVEVKTNALGYRNREIGPKLRPRVLFLGDSITAQDYLPEEETIVRRVEELFEHAEVPIETINAGVGASGLASHLAILRETGLSTQPDVVVVNWYLNDALGSAGTMRTQPGGLAAHSRLVEHVLRALGLLREVTVREDAWVPSAVLESWSAELSRRLPAGPGDYRSEPAAFNRAIQQRARDWGSAWSDGAWRHMRLLFGELAQEADRHGFLLAVVAFPVARQVEADYVYDEPQRRMREVAEELGLPFLDILPRLRGARRRVSLPLFWDHCHPSPFGSRLIAQEVASFLRTRILIDMESRHRDAHAALRSTDRHGST